MTDVHDALTSPIGADGDRQCGRCRLFFADDATRGRPERNAWWVCPRCRAVLLPKSCEITRDIDGVAPTPAYGAHATGR